MSKAETARRYALFLVSLFFSALGVAFTKHGELGVSPISSVANVLSIKFSFLSMGNWLILWNCLLILGQILILRRKFQLVQLLQLPLSFVFGWFTDLGLWMVRLLPTQWYAMRIVYVLLGTAVLGFGIALAVTANVIMNAGEAFVKALSDTLGRQFGSVKIVFDLTNVLLALLLSLLFFDFRIVGMREGTVIAAVLTGVAVKCWGRLLRRPKLAALSDRLLRGKTDGTPG